MDITHQVLDQGIHALGGRPARGAAEGDEALEHGGVGRVRPTQGHEAFQEGDGLGHLALGLQDHGAQEAEALGGGGLRDLGREQLQAR